MKPIAIDGTLDEVQITRPAVGRRPAHYAALDIIDAEGVTIPLRNLRAEPAVAERLNFGAAGRFYIYSVAGFRGVHGFRPVRGAPVFAFPRLPAYACLAIALINLAVIVWRTHSGEALPLFALLPFMLACILYAWLRRTEAEARLAVENDTKPVIIPGQPAPELD